MHPVGAFIVQMNPAFRCPLNSDPPVSKFVYWKRNRSRKTRIAAVTSPQYTGGTEDQVVNLVNLLKHRFQPIIPRAPPKTTALHPIACHATAATHEIEIIQIDDLRHRSDTFRTFRNLMLHQIRVPTLARASIQQDNLHAKPLPLYMLLPKPAAHFMHRRQLCGFCQSHPEATCPGAPQSSISLNSSSITGFHNDR